MTVTDTLQTAISRGIDRLDAQLLLLHVLGKASTERAWLLAHADEALAPSVAAQFRALAERRAAGEPLAYLRGRQAFYGLELAVDARVLIPRPDTETLVDWAIEVIDQHGSRSGNSNFTGDVLDLGTGSGAVAFAVKHSRPKWQVCATDASGDALSVARANAARLGLDVGFSHGNWFDALPGGSGRFDLIVSNPPYIADHDAHLPALAREPRQALTSGADGLDDIRQIAASAPKHLQPSGWLLLEHGYDQAQRVRDVLRQAGFENVQSRRDLGGAERCSGGQISS